MALDRFGSVIEKGNGRDLSLSSSQSIKVFKSERYLPPSFGSGCAII